MRVLLALLLVGIAGGGGGSSPPGEGAVLTPEGSQAKTDKPPAQTANADPVAALETIGAKIKRNEQAEIIEVFLRGTTITDAGLVHLKELTNLQTLNLFACTKITDAGLVHLKELTNLKSLRFGSFRSQITDAGLENLKGMTKLEELLLYCPKVTDAGLVHLTGLANLQELSLGNTKVTDAGVADLQKSLPNCKIYKN